MKKANLFVISGPSGVGKNTVLDRLVEKGLGIYSVSMTTRRKRKGEEEGRDYFFVSKEVFLENIEKDNFFEYAVYNDNYYGTLKSFVFDNIKKGINVIAILDVQGALQVEKVYPDAISIFMMPPNEEELRNRLIKRGTETMEEIEKRLIIAKKEVKYRKRYDLVIVNDIVEDCAKEIEKIILKG